MIEVKDLTKTFQPENITAVQSVSFKLAKGEIASLIGTSGCGKTTTLKMINRLIGPTSGQVLVNGESPENVDAVSWRRRIGYVIQKAGLLPHLTVEENIGLLAKVMGRPVDARKKRVRELMEMVNLPYQKFSGRYPLELSGGQQQRVGIARALIEDPPVLLMDEPFGAVDPITRRSLHDEFLELNQRLEKTILLVTHDIEEAFKLSDKIILMHQGRCVQIGSEQELKNSPSTPFVTQFIQGTLHEEN